MGRWKKKIKNKQYGQAMVEFALTLPIFLLAVLGVIELSRFFLVYSSVYTASREAARFGSSVGEDKITPNYMNCSEIALRAQESGFFGGVNASNVIIYYEQSPTSQIDERVDCDGIYRPKLGDRLVVEVAAEYEPLIIGLILPDGIMVTSENGRTIMKEIEVYATSRPDPVCNIDVQFDGSLYKTSDPNESQTYNNNTLYMNIKNSSSNTSYKLIEVIIDDWQTTSPPRSLMQIKWDEFGIWTGNTTDLPIILPNDDNPFLSQYTRNLKPGEITPIKFTFNNNASTSIGLKFKLTFLNVNVKLENAIYPISACTISW